MEIDIPTMILAGLAIVAALAPLVWLGMRNPRALPIGAFLVAMLAAGGFGILAIGGAAVNPSFDWRQAVWLLGGVLLVLALLALVNLRLMRGTLESRLNWAAVSMGVWMLATVLASYAAEEIGYLFRG